MPATVEELCRKHQLTLTQLIERSGLDESRVTAILLGRWTPAPAERQCIAAVLSTPVDDIAWGHKTPIQHLYGHGTG